MEAHPTLGCIQDQNSGLGLTNHHQELCELQCPNGSFPSLIPWEQNRTIGIRTLCAPGCLPLLALPVVL